MAQSIIYSPCLRSSMGNKTKISNKNIRSSSNHINVKAKHLVNNQFSRLISPQRRNISVFSPRSQNIQQRLFSPKAVAKAAALSIMAPPELLSGPTLPVDTHDASSDDATTNYDL